MFRNQKGFTVLYFALIVGLTATLTASGFILLKKRNNEQSTASHSLEVITAEIEPDGTPANATKATTEQITAEILAEDAALKIEEDASEFDDSQIDELAEVADEANL